MNLTAAAWKAVPKLPAPLARGLFALGADAAWLLHGKGVRQLEANLARVRPGASRRALRRLSREGMRRYLRYYCEAFQLAGWPPAKVDQMVVFKGEAAVRAALGDQGQAVLALAHMGNWDLAGAWATRHLAPVVTVAERLKPEEVFQDFLAMRQAIGLTIVPLEDGKPAFRQLLRAVRSKERWLAPLLADRDLGRGGVEVDFFGEKALMAAGPAALALATGRSLAPVAMYRRGPRYVLEFLPPVGQDAPEPPKVPQRGEDTSGGADALSLPAAGASGARPAPLGSQTGSKQEAIQALTQAWATALEGAIRRHPADWHMLQKVFVADLDPARLAAVRGAGRARAGEARR
ncbi:MAG: phosphatidylinositol mannoside acyltransferase [Bifidobacteriaceae bacterium]|nr:phosphatidylinositol mannoside acyltransferase [Bifidobacteriaceae bacterium]